jgi:aminoglycoside phosphotransferase (APT) family kinase protein
LILANKEITHFHLSQTLNIRTTFSKVDGFLRKLLDSKKLEDYLRVESHYGYSSIVPKDATNVKVSNIRPLSGGMTNNTCSFLLTFFQKGFEHRFDLVMKAYSERVGLWSRIHHADEDIRPYVREFEVLRSLERADFPVPHAYLSEYNSSFLGYPFLIMQ